MAEQYRYTLNDYGGEMTESVKTAGRLHQQRLPADGYTSSMMRRSQHIHIYEANSRAEMQGDGQHAHTYMDIEGGFKKFKSSQVLALQELKQEYQILKNLQIDDKGTPAPHKMADSLSSSAMGDDRSEATSKSKTKKDHGSRQFQLLLLEKKQLEIVVSNSMKKIEELLHQEMELKKLIHSLKIQLQDRSPEQKYEMVISQMKRSENDYQQTIQALKKQAERHKHTISQLNEKIGKLESDIITKDLDLKKEKEEKRRFDDSIRLEKDKYFSLEIEFKRLKMEHQMLQKEKESDVRRLTKQLEYHSHKHDGTAKIKSLEEELQLKDKRYKLLLEELSNPRGDDPTKHDRNNQQIKTLFAGFLSAQGKSSNEQYLYELRQKVSNLVSENRRLGDQIYRLQHHSTSQIIQRPNATQDVFLETIKSLIDRFAVPQAERGQNQMRRQLQFLREQVMNLRSNPGSDKKTKQQQALIKEQEEKIKTLEQKMRRKEDSPTKESKGTTLNELRQSILRLQGVIRELQGKNRDLDMKYRQIDLKYRELQSHYHELESENREYKKVMDEENVEKLKFMEQLRDYKRQCSTVYDSNESISRKLGVANEKGAHQKHQIQILKKELELLKGARGDLTASQTENFNLRLRMMEIDRLQSQTDRLKKECTDLRALLKKKEDQHGEQLRELRRKCDETDFEVSRAKKEGQLNVELLQKDHMSQTTRYRMIAERTGEERNQLLREMEEANRAHNNKIRQLKEENQRLQAMYDSKLAQKSSEVDVIRERFEQRISNKSAELDNWKMPYEQRIKTKEFEFEEQRKQYESLSARIQQRHQEELKSLLRRIDALNEANDKFMHKTEWYMELERDVQELRIKLRHTKSINETVDHLWQVKEAQYANVHEILRQLHA